jgi:DNA-binding beta-propeller fold protein YncE
MRIPLAGAAAAIAPLLASASAGAQPPPDAVAEHRYVEITDWPRLPPTVQLGECAGVAVDPQGKVFVFHRPGRGFDPEAVEPLQEPAVLEVDGATGELVNAWGARTFLVPHGISLDADGNVFLTDVGRQQVFKFSRDGRLLLVVGEPRIGGWDATHFNQPTDIAIRADGSFYVSDGYVNSRVAVFGPDGRHRREWGRKGAGPGEFSNPHGLTFITGSTDVLVADRQNVRLQLFAEDGTFKREWTGEPGAETTGRVFAVAADAAGHYYMGIRRDDYDVAHTGVVKLDRDWRIVSSIGFGRAGHPVFNAVHDLAVGPDGSIYVAETRTKRVVKLRPAASGQGTSSRASVGGPTPEGARPSASSSPDDVITEYRLPPDTLEKAEALYRTMLVVGTLYGFGLLLGLLFFRVAPRFRDVAERASRRRFVQALVFVPPLVLTIDVLSLPLSMYGHYLQTSYGLSVQGWGSWFRDQAKSEIPGLAIGTPLIWGLYAFLRRSPTRWWLYGWPASIPVVLLLVLIGPVFIDPLFNTYAPLEERQPRLVPALEQVMARGGVSIERARMFEMQASDKVTTYN